MLLGDVGQRQEVGEGARHRQRGRHRHLGEAPARASKSPSDPARARFGKGTHVLDEGEDGAPLASDERLAQQFAEQAHVVSERTVGIVLVHAAV